MSLWIFYFAQLAILGYALVAGVFLAFSDFIMRSLARTSGAGGAEAMQVINREVFRWLFMALFLGLVPVSLVLAGYGAAALDGAARWAFVSAGLVYLVGCFGVTARFNVPMNEMLDGMQPGGETGQAYWREVYVPRWTFWNTVRGLACALSAGLAMAGWQALLQAA